MRDTINAKEGWLEVDFLATRVDGIWRDILCRQRVG